MGLIQNKLRQNSFQSMSFLFFIIFIWHVIIDINMFLIYLSIATKEVVYVKDRLHGLDSKKAEAKFLPKYVLFILYYLHLA